MCNTVRRWQYRLLSVSLKEREDSEPGPHLWNLAGAGLWSARSSSPPVPSGSGGLASSLPAASRKSVLPPGKVVPVAYSKVSPNRANRARNDPCGGGGGEQPIKGAAHLATPTGRARGGMGMAGCSVNPRRSKLFQRTRQCHYAPRSPWPRPTTACPLLERLEADEDRIAVWRDVLANTSSLRRHTAALRGGKRKPRTLPRHAQVALIWHVVMARNARQGRCCWHQPSSPRLGSSSR
jgi:hypothetical protein